jgi:hypothetical protein
VASGAALCLPAAIALLFRGSGWRLLRRIAFALVPAAALFVVLETALRLAGVDNAVAVRVVASERLGHALAPDRGEADERGFRNAQALASADVVAIPPSVATYTTAPEGTLIDWLSPGIATNVVEETVIADVP